MSDMKLTRRAFLAATTTTAMLTAAGCATKTNTAKVVPGKVSPNQKLNIAAIGAGGKGWSDINGCSKTENIVALCDPDAKNAAEAFFKIKDAKQYSDYRVMLEEMKDIDACTISTPDHTHAPAAYMAMKLGKHVYVQKPLTHTVAEARLLRDTAREMKVITQMGNQGRSGDGARELCEFIWSGALGDVTDVHTWTNRPIWPQGIPAALPEQAIPDTMKWDTWIGTAPVRPFNEKYAPFNWRGWWDFGCGALGDMACHIMDPAFWALKLADADYFEVELVQQDGKNDQTAPNSSIIKYTFPARADMGPVTLTWYDGKILPKHPEGVPADQKIGDGENGSLFYGTKAIGTSGTYGGESRLLPDGLMKDFKRPAPSIERVPGEDHYVDWLDAIKGNKAAACSNFDVAGPFTEMVDFGNVALRTGEKVKYDFKTGKIMNANIPQSILTKEYRKGWELPC
ncbi:MAG: Gfo/Idh/MocA family oxidoreductase [Candidatus Hydrogenedentes bacterium]|nr:Gfo/Idh/MocA family oxidoreductase [Candidatus Hydrogenedentota bacterium]